MASWEFAMRIAEKKAFATRSRWLVLGHRANGRWCYHPYSLDGTGQYRRKLPPRERA